MPSPKNTATRSRRAAVPKPLRRRNNKRSSIQEQVAASHESSAEAETYEAWNARLSKTLDLENLDERERAFLATCQKIHRRESGVTSPFENFMGTLVRSVGRGDWPTPGDVSDELKEFEENFAFMRKNSSSFIGAYPQGLADPLREEAAPPHSSKTQLTSDEFITLKEYLHRVRGFVVQEEAANANKTTAGRAALVDPMGHKPEALSVEEFTELRRLLDIRRNDKEGPLHDAVNWLLSAELPTGMNASAVFGQITHHFLSEEHDEAGGLITNRFGKNIEPVSNDEYENLTRTLSALRLGGWFAAWLGVQVGSIAGAICPEDRYPSPLKLMASLVLDLKEYEEALDAARAQAQMRPDLFATPSAEPSAPEPQASSPRSRNSRRKVGRAS